MTSQGRETRSRTRRPFISNFGVETNFKLNAVAYFWRESCRPLGARRGGSRTGSTTNCGRTAVEIDVIAVELDGADLKKDAAMWDLLKSKGYEVYSTTTGGSGQREDNTWFVRKAAVLHGKPGIPEPGPPLSPFIVA